MLYSGTTLSKITLFFLKQHCIITNGMLLRLFNLKDSLGFTDLRTAKYEIYEGLDSCQQICHSVKMILQSYLVDISRPFCGYQQIKADSPV